MPKGQVQYFMAEAFPGQIASYQDYTVRKSVQDECFNASNQTIGFGLGLVSTGTEDGGLGLPTAAGQTIVGFSFIQAYANRIPFSNEVGIPANRPMSYLSKGIIYVTVDSAINRGGDVYVVMTGANAGRITATAGGNTLLSANKAHYRVLDNAAAQGDLVRLELDLPTTLLV